MQEIKYCNHCPTRASCVYFKKNNSCEKDQLLKEDIFGFKKTNIDKWYFLINLDRTRDKNKAEFYKRVNTEIKELMEAIQEQIEDEKESGVEENAGL